jgi:hypothetical protein
MNSRATKVRQATPSTIEETQELVLVSHERAAALAVIAPDDAGAPSALAQHSLDPHVGHAQFALIAALGVTMFVGFGALAVTGASTHPHGTSFLSALSALGLGLAWFYGGSLKTQRKRARLAPSAHVPSRTVLPARPLVAQGTMRRGLHFMLAFFSASTMMFAHLCWWIATRTPNAHTVGAYVGAAFVGLFGVLTAFGAAAIIRELRGHPPYGAPSRVEHFCRVLEVRAVPTTALEPGGKVFVIEHPRGGKPLEWYIPAYESPPWITAGHALVVFAPSHPESPQLLREDGSPFELSEDDIATINAGLDTPRGYRS